MRYLMGRCTKCGATIKVVLGDLTPEEAKKKLEGIQMFECPGHHVELSGPLGYWEVDWETVHEDDANPPTDEEWLAGKREQYEHVVDTGELDSVVDEVVGFSMGVCVVMRKGRKEYVDFADSPSGKRYYFVGLKGAVRIPIAEGA
jgi:hypothetical protein